MLFVKMICTTGMFTMSYIDSFGDLPTEDFSTGCVLTAASQTTARQKVNIGNNSVKTVDIFTLLKILLDKNFVK